MRRKLLLGFILIASGIVSVFPIARSGTALTFQEPRPVIDQAEPTRLLLPEFDIRLADKGEFQEHDLNSTGGMQNALQNIATLRAASAVEQFRAISGSGERLRAVVNETGALKQFFVDGGSLASPQVGAPDAIARNFLNQHPSLFLLSAPEVAHLKLIREDLDDGTTFLSYVQRIGGVKVFDGDVQVVVNKAGEVLSVREGFLITGQTAGLAPGLTEAQALYKAFEYAGRKVEGVFTNTDASATASDFSVYTNPLGANYENVLSELVVFRLGDSARLAWHVYVEVAPNEWYEVVVDADTGNLLLRHNLYVFEAQGTVYTVHPTAGPRQLLSFLGNTTFNTSAGWMGTSTVTTGNNVDAYLDTDANNAPDTNNNTGLSNGRAFSSSQNFTFPFSTAVDPRTQQPAVVTNLFYFNNLMHDFSYGLGFTETAGNFQTNNFGRGGLGSDSVRAEAQDGSGVNNANFATPPDGLRPRMQQYLFTAPSPDRDSSVDGDVVFHEYGHGISNRLIGNGSGLGGVQSGAMGEGWSDYWALTITNHGVMGEYVTQNATNGIRRAAYSVPAAPVHDSYADLGTGGFQVHRDGEVWAATLWDLRTQLGRTISDRLVLNGMKFTPSRPSFLNARDGILQADQNLNAGANRCMIWTVFARHGMGFSAVGNDGTTHVAATDTPVECGGTPPTRPPNDNFANAQTISGNSGSATGTNVNATKEVGEPNHVSSGGKSVWYRWQAPGSGTATITTVGSNFDTLLAVYTGTSVSALTVVASNDDHSGVLTSRVTFSAVSGTIYRIAVDGYASASGNITLNWSLAGSGPSPPTAIAATSVTNNSFAARWNSSSGATGYRLDVSPNSSFTTFVTGYQNLNVGNVLTRSVTGLGQNTTYYYRLRAFNGTGTSVNSNTISTTTTNTCTAPGAFTQSLPSNGQSFSSATTSVALSWGASARATSYDVYFGTSSNPPLVANQAGTSRTVNVAAGQTYYWKVVARVSCNSALTSTTTIRSFSVQSCLAPGAFTQSSPSNGQSFTSATTSVPLSWGASARATSYDVYFGTSSNPPFVANQTGTSRTVNVTSGQTYYWKIVARVSCNSVLILTTTIRSFSVAQSSFQLLLEQFGPVPNLASAIDAILLLRDPFPVINGANVLNQTSDKNTRVVIFLSNFQLQPGETAASVVINLIGSNNQSFDVVAEEVLPVANSPFTQVTFRLPNGLAIGTCTIRVRARGQVSNSAVIRIKA